jgi:hypothetical protein
VSDITPEYYFKSADELGAYAINYYESVLTTWRGNYNAGPINEDGDTDNMVVGDANTSLFATGYYLVPDQGGPSYTLIRAMNYFLENVLPKYEAGEIEGSEDVVKHYIGEVYFMRAMAYYEQLKEYGDFPIITVVPNDNREELIELSKRAPRNEVARFILGDLDKAISMLKSGSAYNKVRISKEVALLMKSRVALFEASFETYHKGTPRVPGEQGWPGANMSYNAGKTFDINGEISFFLDEALSASEQVADATTLCENTKVINPAVDQTYGWNPYFEMFSMPDPSSISEVLLWRMYDSSLGIVQGYMPYITEGGNNGMTKSYVDAYLMANGLPIYAAGSGYQGDVTLDKQVADRDNRLQLFVYSNSTVVYNRDSLTLFEAPLLLQLLEHRDRTGFRQRKHVCYDRTQIDNGIKGTNGYVVYRSVEAYLNYIEAYYMKNKSIGGKADTYWRAIRRRAGVDEDYNKTIAATDLSKEPDWAVYSGDNMVDATLYNIRRERRCEFIGEGMRKDDLLRWRSYDALFKQKYIPEGVNLWDELYQNKKYLKQDASGAYTTESLLVEQAAGLGSANISNRNDSKYVRPYRLIKENNDIWDGYTWKKAHYLSPYSPQELRLASPNSDIATSNLYQNPYWPTTASEGALE